MLSLWAQARNERVVLNVEEDPLCGAACLPIWQFVSGARIMLAAMTYTVAVMMFATVIAALGNAAQGWIPWTVCWVLLVVPTTIVPVYSTALAASR